MEQWEILLNAKIEALGNSATNEQVDRFVDWVIKNVPKAYWGFAKNEATMIRGAYTELSMRMGESGQY